MSEEYSGKPLSQRLGIKSGATIAVVDAPLNYWKLLGGLPDQVSLCDPHISPVDFIHIFVKDKSALKMRLEKLNEQIAPGGLIWISWPKESSNIQTDIDENTIRELALESGLINTSACVVDETWAAIRLVAPLNS